MKDILFVIPTLGGGGAEKVLLTLLNNLDKEKYNITLLSIFNEGVNKKKLNKSVNYKYFFKKAFRGNKYIFKLFTPRTLYNIMIRDEYDIIISYLEGPATRIVGGCPNLNTKLINWVHTEPVNKKNFTTSYRNSKEMYRIYNKYDTTVFVSNNAKESFIKMFPEIRTKMIVKYNAVNDRRIKTLSEKDINKKLFKKEKINFISSGRHIKVKGYIRLINIINLLVQDGYTDIHLYLLGEGKLTNTYEKLLEKYSLQKYITLLGYKDNPYKYVRNADFFISSSYREGFSTVVTESLIIGTPVITTACSGMEELLGSNNKFGIITDNTEEALLDGIKKILKTPGLIQYYKVKTLERSDEFKLSRTIEEVEKLLQNI